MENHLIQNRSLPGLHALIHDYDAYLIDLWGVVYDGDTPYPKAVEAINQLLHHEKPVVFLSNVPRPGSITLEKLFKLGIKKHPLLSILTSGDLAREVLQTLALEGKQIYHLDDGRNKDILDGLGITPVDRVEKAHLVLLTAYAEACEGAHYYDVPLHKAAELGIPVLCANPDKSVLHQQTHRYCAGTFAERCAEAGGVVHYYGKPHAAIFDKACEGLRVLGVQDKNRILMIGDTPETDLQGASNGGVQGLLVLTGNMERRNPANLTTTYPHWILPALQW